MPEVKRGSPPGSLRPQRERSAPEEDDGCRIGPKGRDLGTWHASRVERVEEAGARQGRLHDAPARGSDGRLAAVAEAQQVDLAPGGPIQLNGKWRRLND